MGFKVKEFREKAHLTQEELATKSGVSRGTIVALEKSNTYTTTTRTLAKIAKALNTTVDELFCIENVQSAVLNS